MPKSQTNSWHQEEPMFKTDFHKYEQVHRVFGKPVITKRQATSLAKLVKTQRQEHSFADLEMTQTQEHMYTVLPN